MGYVQHVRADEAGEIAALEHALEVDPCCSDAARYLAETYNRRGDLPSCRAVLERSLEHDPDNAINRGYLAETLWHLGERSAALENIQHAIRLAPDEDWSWNALRHWAGEAAKDDPSMAGLPAKFARELAQSQPDDVDAWVALAGVLERPEDRKEAHAALDRALELDPRHISAHMQRATLLAEDEQFDAAIVACHPPLFGERPPTPLLMHAAEIEVQRGNLVAAVAQLQDVVLDEPDFFWGWKRLADLYEMARDWNSYVHAAEQMARIEPQEPSCWGYLADARMHLEDRSGAKRDLQRAIELAPDYPFAVNLLLNLQFEDGELEGAGKTLDRACPYMPPALAAAHLVRLDSRRKDETAAVEHFRLLCQAPPLGVEPFYGAIDEMLDAGWQEVVDRELAQAVSQPQAGPHLGAVWVEWCASHNRFDRCLEALEAFRGQGPVWFAAAESYVNELADAGQAQQLQSFLSGSCDELRKEARTWAAAGGALAQLGLAKDAVLWLSDWQSRQDVRPYMLVALVGALWELGREDEAAKISTTALFVPVDDSSKAVHALWLALHAVVRGKPEDALPLLARLSPELFHSDFYATLCVLVRTLADLEASPEQGGAKLNYAAARVLLRDAILPFQEQIGSSKLLRRIVYRCLTSLARHYGQKLIALWWGLRAKLA
jgi:tetratricopeptide (TPR) repeat protein